MNHAAEDEEDIFLIQYSNCESTKNSTKRITGLLYCRFGNLAPGGSVDFVQNQLFFFEAPWLSEGTFSGVATWCHVKRCMWKTGWRNSKPLMK